MPDFSQKKAMARKDKENPERPSRVVSGAAWDDDARIDASVRPKRLDEYIGQKRVRKHRHCPRSGAQPRRSS